MVDVMNLQRRTIRYEFADGIRDFQTAIWLVLIGFYAWIMWDMPEVWMEPIARLRASTGNPITGILVFIVMVSIPYAITQGALHLMNEYVRRRWLWRETGFIKSKATLLPRGVGLVGGLISFVTFIGGILSCHRIA